MLIKNFAIAASVLALTACTGAQSDRTGAGYNDADQKDRHTLVMDGYEFAFSAPQMTQAEQLELRREINGEVRLALAEAWPEIVEALAETRSEPISPGIDTPIDEDGLSETVMIAVQNALQEAQRRLEEAETRLARDEERLTRQAGHMARQAEEMKRRAAEMKGKSGPLWIEPPKAPLAPEAPKTDRSDQSPSPLSAPSANKPLNLHRRVLVPYLH